ncbi:MAG TPA: sigma-70 family RNA polymerase sigma factor [Stellaceae bacterium]|nr:sigma-70 family RNA polymerase sigma factor [Stellaceae bacterium]
MTFSDSELRGEIPYLRRYARSLVHNSTDADDLVQDCLLRAIDKKHLWCDGTNLRAWLTTILRNLYVNGVRRSINQKHIGLPLTDELMRTSQIHCDPLAMLFVEDVARSLALLPQEQRRAVIQAMNYSYDEIAANENVPVGTIRSRLSRGRAALRLLSEK